MSDCGCGGSCGCGGHAQALDFSEESKPSHATATNDLAVRVGAVERALLALAAGNLSD